MSGKNPLNKLAGEVVYENHWIKIHVDKVAQPDGGEGIYGYMESKDSVKTLVLNEKNEIFLVKVFCYPHQSWNWELPGGGSDGENPVAASKRELAEETGIVAKDWTKLGCTRVCGGLMTEKTWYYLAEDLEFKKRIWSSDEKIVTNGTFFSWYEINKMIDHGVINDNQTVTGLFFLNHWHAIK